MVKREAKNHNCIAGGDLDYGRRRSADESQTEEPVTDIDREAGCGAGENAGESLRRAI